MRADMPAAVLFPRLLGSAFAGLPSTVQVLHLRDGLQRYRGEVDVERGLGLLSRLCAWATRLPPAGQGPIVVEINTDDRREQWTRIVARHAMHSSLWADNGLLRERLGLVTFGFRLTVENHAILWRVASVHALGVRLPATWFKGVTAREFEREGRYAFDVAARMPVAGLLVHYRGTLDVG